VARMVRCRKREIRAHGRAIYQGLARAAVSTDGEGQALWSRTRPSGSGGMASSDLARAMGVALWPMRLLVFARAIMPEVVSEKDQEDGVKRARHGPLPSRFDSISPVCTHDAIRKWQAIK